MASEVQRQAVVLCTTPTCAKWTLAFGSSGRTCRVITRASPSCTGTVWAWWQWDATFPRTCACWWTTCLTRASTRSSSASSSGPWARLCSASRDRPHRHGFETELRAELTKVMEVLTSERERVAGWLTERDQALDGARVQISQLSAANEESRRVLSETTQALEDSRRQTLEENSNSKSDSTCMRQRSIARKRSWRGEMPSVVAWSERYRASRRSCTRNRATPEAA